VVAQHQIWPVFGGLAQKRVVGIRESIVEMGFPDPFDLVTPIREVGHIMHLVAGLDQRFTSFSVLNRRVSITMPHCWRSVLPPFWSSHILEMMGRRPQP
jgi:hypothetical protein